MFQRTTSAPFSGWKSKPSKKPAEVRNQLKQATMQEHTHLNVNLLAVQTCLLPWVSCLAYCWVLKMEVMYSFEALNSLWTILHYNSEDCTLHSHCCENLKTNIIFLIDIVGGGVQLGPLGTAATYRPIVPAPGDYDDGEIGGIIGKGNRSTRRKPPPVLLCPPQTPHAAWTRTWAAAVGSQQLTTWANAWP
jgi:hypothetical protein